MRSFSNISKVTKLQHWWWDSGVLTCSLWNNDTQNGIGGEGVYPGCPLRESDVNIVALDRQTQGDARVIRIRVSAGVVTIKSFGCCVENTIQDRTRSPGPGSTVGRRKWTNHASVGYAFFFIYSACFRIHIAPRAYAVRRHVRVASLAARHYDVFIVGLAQFPKSRWISQFVKGCSSQWWNFLEARALEGASVLDSLDCLALRAKQYSKNNK